MFYSRVVSFHEDKKKLHQDTNKVPYKINNSIPDISSSFSLDPKTYNFKIYLKINYKQFTY